MLQRIGVIILLISCMTLTFSASAPAIAQSGPEQGLADGSQPAEFIQKFDHASVFASRRIIAALTHIPKIPDELGQAFNRLTGGGGLPSFLGMLGVILGILAAGFGVELLFKRYTTKFYKQIESIPRMGEVQKFWSAILRIVTALLGLFIFTLFSIILFMLIYGAGRSSARLLFIALLLVLLGSRLISILSNSLYSPSIARLRLIKVSDATAVYLHRYLVLLARIIAFGWVFCLVINRLGVLRDTFLLMIITFGTIVIAMLAAMVWENRQAVSQAISGGDFPRHEGENWLTAQFAAIWHILALGYLFIVWLFWSGRLIIFQSGGRGTFLISLLIVPIFLIVDRLGQWVVNSIMGTNRIKSDKSQQPGTAAAEADGNPIEAADGRYHLMARKIVRGFIFLAMFFWLLSIWGLHLPFGEKLAQATFSVLITLALAHIFWRAANSYVDRKLRKDLPAAESDTEAKKVDEWGAAASMTRSHTLLPLLRKFIGSVLIVMVIMIALASLGVNIAPLLAGAGVVGLAIGIGSRKLVSDILAGFFNLMDDAFRVGEYLKCGNISGMVEKITLRNVFLRHHRGMLQIVPHSNMGNITNFMRGGLVEKFNLQLPYDTDIEKVRKIVKKVGDKMLLDEELGPNFIQPLKSQGVREVGDSVMTFRVKFTAKPGKHFLIRREAYKLITQALQKEGIHYAHRKVIVDLPEPPVSAATLGGPQTRPAPDIATAGAAAALQAILDEEKKAKAAQEKK